MKKVGKLTGRILLICMTFLLFNIGLAYADVDINAYPSPTSVSPGEVVTYEIWIDGSSTYVSAADITLNNPFSLPVSDVNVTVKTANLPTGWMLIGPTITTDTINFAVSGVGGAPNSINSNVNIAQITYVVPALTPSGTYMLAYSAASELLDETGATITSGINFIDGGFQVTGSCTDTCASLGYVCGTVCGQDCGDCTGTDVCELGACVPCTPDCTSKACDEEDGCGTLCGCPIGKTCVASVCENSCTNECPTIGDRDCDGSTPRECIIGGSGCNVWSSLTACVSPQVCELGACVDAPAWAGGMALDDIDTTLYVGDSDKFNVTFNTDNGLFSNAIFEIHSSSDAVKFSIPNDLSDLEGNFSFILSFSNVILSADGKTIIVNPLVIDDGHDSGTNFETLLQNLEVIANSAGTSTISVTNIQATVDGETITTITVEPVTVTVTEPAQDPKLYISDITLLSIPSIGSVIESKDAEFSAFVKNSGGDMTGDFEVGIYQYTSLFDEIVGKVKPADENRSSVVLYEDFEFIGNNNHEEEVSYIGGVWADGKDDTTKLTVCAYVGASGGADVDYWQDILVGEPSRACGEFSVADGDDDGDGYPTDTEEDCDDDDEFVWQNLNGYVDADGDGYTIGEAVVLCTDGNLPSGYISIQNDGDCNDSNDSINPLASEICDGVDNDCDTATEDGSGQVAPFNSNQTGVCLNSIQECTSGNWVDNYAITNYEDPEITCDGLDNNCNGTVDEGCECIENQPCGKDVGICTSGIQVCTAGVLGACLNESGYGFPIITETPEICDGLDNDCDENIDEDESGSDLTEACYTDDDPLTKNVGLCQEGVRTCVFGGWGSCVDEVIPDTEVCDDLDNDCDGETDEGLKLNYYLDSDGDGFGDGDGAAVPTEYCEGDNPSNYVLDSTDCDDSDGDIHPGAEEICDGIDNDCNATTIEVCGCTENQPCGTDVGLCTSGIQICTAGVLDECRNYDNDPVFGEPIITASPEVCDNELDDDCDGDKDCLDEDCAGSAACSSPVCGLNVDTNDIYTNATCSYDGTNYVEYCSSSYQVVEYNCGAVTCESTVVNCPEGYICSNGACKIEDVPPGVSLVVTNRNTNTIVPITEFGLNNDPGVTITPGTYRFDAYIKPENDLQNHIVILQIMDENNETVAFSYIAKEGIQAGEVSVLGVTYTVAEGDYTDWTVKAFVWNHWITNDDWQPLFDAKQLLVDLPDAPVDVDELISCEDLDDGEDYYTFGTVTETYESGKLLTYTDACVEEDLDLDILPLGAYAKYNDKYYDDILSCVAGSDCYIAEAVCLDNTSNRFVVSECLEGCENGACKEDTGGAV